MTPHLSQTPGHGGHHLPSNGTMGTGADRWLRRISLEKNDRSKDGA